MTTRLVTIDLLRAVAIVTMVMVHFAENLSGYTPVYAGLGAPLFVFLSGASHFLWSKGLLARGASEIEVTKVSVRRGLFVFGAGFAFNLLVWLPEDLFNWDVLTLIGSALVVLGFARRLPRGILVLIAALALVVAPILRDMAGYPAYWENGYFECDLTLGDILVGYVATGYFPLFPWIAFSLAGHATASWMFAPRASRARDPMRIAAIGAGIAATGGALLLLRPVLPEPVPTRILGGWTMFPPTIEYALAMLGLAMVLLSLGHRFVDPLAGSGRFKAVFGTARSFSQYSLTIYIVHHVAHLWPLWIYGLVTTGEPTEYWKLAMPVGVSMWLGVGFLLACLVILRLAGPRRSFGFEALMRWICD